MSMAAQFRAERLADRVLFEVLVVCFIVLVGLLWLFGKEICLLSCAHSLIAH